MIVTIPCPICGGNLSARVNLVHIPARPEIGVPAHVTVEDVHVYWKSHDDEPASPGELVCEHALAEDGYAPLIDAFEATALDRYIHRSPP